jgi:hypothetical protein
MNISIIKYFFLSLVLGLVAIIYLLDYDQEFKNFVGYHVKKIFLSSFKCVLRGEVKSVSVLRGEIELENVFVLSPDSKNLWHWEAKKFILQFSWLSFLLKGKFDVVVLLDTLDSHSDINGSTIAIVGHLKNFIAGAEGFPATLKMLTIDKGHFVLNNQEHRITFDTFFNGNYGNTQGWLRLNLHINEGALYHAQQQICNDFSGTLHVSIPDLKNNVIEATVSGKFGIPQLRAGKNVCSIDGQWHADKGQLFLNTSDKNCSLTLYNWAKTSKDIAGDLMLSIPFDYINLLVPSLQRLKLEGKCRCQAHFNYADDYDLEGTVSIDNLQCHGNKLGMMQMDIERKHGLWQGECNSCYTNSMNEDIQGVFNYDEYTRKGSLVAQNTAPLHMPQHWIIDTQDCSLYLDMLDGIGKGSYCCVMHNSKTASQKTLEGVLNLDSNQTTLEGLFNNKKYEAKLCFNPYPLLTEFVLYEKLEKPLLQIRNNADKGFTGIVDFGLLQEVSHNLFNYKIPGQGILQIDGYYDNNCIHVAAGLLKGSIRIPETYTLIRDIKGAVVVDLINKNIVIKDAAIQLDKGSLLCTRAVVHLNDKGLPSFIYMPWCIKKAFLTLQKELFAVFSGNIVYTYSEGERSELAGKIIIDRGYCKKNIFAQFGGKKSVDVAGSRNDLNIPCGLDIVVETKNPLEVKTSFLDTQVQIGVAVQGSLQNPELSGSLNLENGTLAFPYRPLTITHAKIYFLPHQLYDPVVELIAKGKIRKYQVTLRCNGSLKHPHISFESTPPLTEEQIITLLIAGSEEGSLSLAMPAMIMQNLQNIIFGPEQPASKLEGYFKSFLEPFKHIRFIPGFSDQSGRGGFRGTIEIDVNDQLRGMIQKNFSLSEDIKLEVEYFLSDDITVRGMRDERGDYGGEVEMRWKF